MLNRSKLTFFGLLLLECAICVAVGSFFYRRYQKAQVQEQAEYIVRLSRDTIQATESGALQYYYTLKSGALRSESPSWLGYVSVQSYNQDGLNDRFDYSIAKNPENLRIIAVGDSFTHGDFVSTPANWTELLEDNLNQSESKLCGKKRVEVINLGVTGFDVEYIAHRYRDLGVKYQPDLIVWFESGSGFSRMNELMQPQIRDCQEKGLKLTLSESEKVRYEYQCWLAAESEVKRTHEPSQLRDMINQSYDLFFEAASKVPVLIIAYEDPSTENRVAMTEQYLNGHPNAQFLPIMPLLTPETRLADGHPSSAGHKQMEEVIRKQLQKMQSEICPTAK